MDLKGVSREDMGCVELVWCLLLCLALVLIVLNF